MKFLDIEDIDIEPAESPPATRPGTARAPELIMPLTSIDGRKLFVAADFIAAVLEPDGMQKSQGVGALVFFRDIAGGASGVNARETHDEVHAAWRMALGLKGGVQ